MVLLGAEAPENATVYKRKDTYIWRCVNIVDGSRVQINGMESLVGAVEHLQSSILLHRQINYQRQVRQLPERLKTKYRAWQNQHFLG